MTRTGHLLPLALLQAPATPEKLLLASSPTRYVLHHARLVSIIPLFLAGALLFSFPVFDVALGAALIAAMAGPTLSDWKNENR
jgi:hypothetical protein